MNKYGQPLATLLLCFAVFNAKAAEPARLAVLSATSDFAPYADLLSAQLSGTNEVTLLERDQVARVWKEQELAGSQRSSLVKLGRVLNADGVLILERRVASGNETLSARLLAVKPGVIIDEHRFAMPLTDAIAWSQSCAERLKTLLPKLKVRAEDAIPLSLLNLRSSMRMPEQAVPEQELTALLQLRLSHEPAIFVLERRQMSNLESEKQLSGGDVEPFWNGAYVIDGLLNRDMISPDRITVDARMIPPRGASVEIKVQGRRDALRELVEELAAKILSSANKTLARTWDAQAEAEKFEQEAAWAWRWGLWPQAGEAADASWALRRWTYETAKYRYYPRTHLALALRTPPEWAAAPTPYSFRAPPTPKALSLLVAALEIYRDSFRVFQQQTNGLNPAFVGDGFDMLLGVASVLEQFNERVELLQDNEDLLKQVRATSREVVTLLQTNRERLALTFVTLGRSIEGICVQANGAWMEKPEDAVALYLTFLEPEKYKWTTDKLASKRIPLLGWTYQDRKKLRSTWLGFLREMGASTNARIRLDGMEHFLEHSVNPDELVAVARKYADEAYQQRLSIFAKKIYAPLSEVMSNLTKRVTSWGAPQPEIIKEIAENWEQRYRAAGPDLSYQVWKERLALKSDPDIKNYDFTYPEVSPKPAQVTELVESFEALGRKRGEGFVRSDIRRLLVQAGLTNEEPRVFPPRTNAPWQLTTLPISKVFSPASLRLPPGRTMSTSSGAQRLGWRPGELSLEQMTSDFKNQSPRTSIVTINTKTMAGECLELPFIRRELIPVPCPRLSVGNETFVVDVNSVWRKQPGSDWRQIQVPLSNGAIPYWWNGRLVLSAEHSILEVNPKTDEVRILASSRRSPPVTALDQQAKLAFAPLAVWPGERLCVLASGQVWSYDPGKSDWNVLFSATNCGELLELHSSGIFYRQSGECGPWVLGGIRPGSSKLNIYTSESVPGRERSGLPYLEFSPGIWTSPREFHPHDRIVAFDGPDILAINAGFNWVRRFGTTSSAQLFVKFDHRYKQPLSFLPEFTGQAASFFGSNRPAPAQFTSVTEFVATPEGFALLIGRDGTVVWIPKEDVEQAVRLELVAHPQPKRADLATISRFDRNQNGWLDDEEMEVMRKDKVFQAGQMSVRNEAARNAIMEHEAEWNTIFTNVDLRHDGKLSVRDLMSAKFSHPQVFVPLLAGVYVELEDALRPFDLDNDKMLAPVEFIALMASPRSLAEMNLVPDWVTKFGLKIEDCDTNSDGFLDTEERRRVKQMIEARLGGTNAKRN